MKNKVLSKVMITVALVFCSMFLFVACTWQKDVNISKIEVIEETLPQSICVGEFDNAGIQLLVTYEDDSTENVPVTTQMIPDEYKNCLATPGIYQIEILFKGFTTEICVNIVSDNIFVVNFYNALGRLISRQYVEKGKDAVAPADTYFAIDGYSFVGWDRTYTNVNENIDVYGIYIKVENVLTNENIYSKLLNAYDYMRVNNYIFTLATEDTYVTTNYHYSKQGGVSTSQTIARYSDNSFWVTNHLEDYYEYYEQGINENPHYQKNYYSEVFGDNHAGKMEAIMMGGLESVSLLSNDKTEYSSYSYVLTNNTNIYTVDSVLKLNTIDEEIYLHVKFIFDDEKMLTIERYYDYGDGSKNIEKIDFEYTTVEFDETLIPEEAKTTNN